MPSRSKALGDAIALKAVEAALSSAFANADPAQQERREYQQQQVQFEAERLRLSQRSAAMQEATYRRNVAREDYDMAEKTRLAELEQTALNEIMPVDYLDVDFSDKINIIAGKYQDIFPKIAPIIQSKSSSHAAFQQSRAEWMRAHPGEDMDVQDVYDNEGNLRARRYDPNSTISKSHVFQSKALLNDAVAKGVITPAERKYWEESLNDRATRDETLQWVPTRLSERSGELETAKSVTATRDLLLGARSNNLLTKEEYKYWDSALDDPKTQAQTIKWAQERLADRASEAGSVAGRDKELSEASAQYSALVNERKAYDRNDTSDRVVELDKQIEAARNQVDRLRGGVVEEDSRNRRTLTTVGYFKEYDELSKTRQDDEIWDPGKSKDRTVGQQRQKLQDEIWSRMPENKRFYSEDFLNADGTLDQKTLDRLTDDALVLDREGKAMISGWEFKQRLERRSSAGSGKTAPPGNAPATPTTPPANNRTAMEQENYVTKLARTYGRSPRMVRDNMRLIVMDALAEAGGMKPEQIGGSTFETRPGKQLLKWARDEPDKYEDFINYKWRTLPEETRLAVMRDVEKQIAIAVRESAADRDIQWPTH